MSNEAQAKADKPKPKSEKKIQITVVTTAGDHKGNYPVEEPLQKVFDDALELVGGQGTADQFSLEYENEQLTDLAKTIAEYAEQFGWEKKVELELVPAPEVV